MSWAAFAQAAAPDAQLEQAGDGFDGLNVPTRRRTMIAADASASSVTMMSWIATLMTTPPRAVTDRQSAR